MTHRQISALFWINVLIGFALSLLAVGVAPLIAWLYEEPRTLTITVSLSSLIFLTSLSVLPAALMNRQMRFVSLAVVDVGCMLVGLLLATVSAWCGLGYWSLILMQMGNSVTSLALMWRFTAWRPSWPRPEPGVWSLVRFGANLMGSNLASFFSMSADNLLVGAIAGPVALGLYDTSYNLVVKPLGALIAPISRIAIPTLARVVSLPDRYQAAYLQMVQVMLLAYVPGVLFGIFFAKPLILLLLGVKWAATAPVFAWICFGGIFAPLFSSTTWLLTTQDRTRELMMISTMTAILSVMSFAIGIVWGVKGVAMLSALCFSFLQFPLMMWTATRVGPISLGALLRSLLPFLVSALATSAALAALTSVVSTRKVGMLALFLTASYFDFGHFPIRRRAIAGPWRATRRATDVALNLP